MKARLPLFAAALLSPLSCWSAESSGATLAAVVDAAVRRSPVIAQAEAGVREADAGLTEARWRSFPVLTGRGSFMRGDDPVFAFGSLLQQRRFTAGDFAIGSLNHPGYRTDIKSALEAGLPLFTGFQLQTGRRLARLGVLEARSGAASAREAARFQAVEGYLQALRSGAALALLDARLASAGEDVAEAEKLKGRGLVLGSDFQAAQAILSGLQAWRARLGGQARAASARLAVLTGAAVGVAASSSALSGVPYPLPPLETLLASAVRSRQDLQRAALEESAAGERLSGARYGLLPSVEAFASVETHSRDLGVNPSQRMAGVRASLPLGDPSYLPRKARAKAAQESAQGARLRLEQDARIEVEALYRDYEGLQASLPASRQASQSAETSLQLFKPLYREGRQSVLEVLRAEEGLARAQAAYLDGLFELHAGHARLLMAAGLLDDAAVAEMDRRLGGAP